jgi:hypothetical protein
MRGNSGPDYSNPKFASRIWGSSSLAPNFPAFLLITILALLLYLPLLSIQYDTNGIIEAIAVENGPLVNKNHVLYRPLGLLVWNAVRLAGYKGNSLLVLQCVSALAGALGVGFTYLAFKTLIPHRTVAAVAALALGTSFTYWVSSTDVFYVPLAGMFAAAALACTVRAQSNGWLVAAGVLTGFSILTWQASIFLIPALLLLLPAGVRKLRSAAVFAGTAVAFAGVAYAAAAFLSRGLLGPGAAWTWLTSYNEESTLSIWGTWQFSRIPVALVAAINSIVPVQLGAGLREILHGVQLGRIAVDVAAVFLIVMLILAALKTRSMGLRFLAAYLCFLPFITWWDPGSHKWFLVPNIFLAGFLLLGVAEWQSRRIASLVLAAGVFIIVATNFVTTVRPRRFNPGSDRPMAACVASHMEPKDMFVATEWGWPDYLEYFHERSALNVINETAHFGNKSDAIQDVRLRVDEVRKAGGQAYVADPRHYSESQLRWLHDTTGISLDDLLALGGAPAFVCNDVPIQRL